MITISTYENYDVKVEIEFIYRRYLFIDVKGNISILWNERTSPSNLKYIQINFSQRFSLI